MRSSLVPERALALVVALVLARGPGAAAQLGGGAQGGDAPPPPPPTERAPDSPPARPPGEGGAGAPDLPPDLPLGTPSVGADEPAAELDPSSWELWWRFSRESWLDLRGNAARAVLSGADGFYLGHGFQRLRRAEGRRPDEEEITTRVVPTLVALLADERAPAELVHAALIALARVGDDQGPEQAQELERRIVPFLHHGNARVSETATLALGILGEPGSALLLSELLLDTDAGRKAVQASRVPLRMRAFAAYALGLSGADSENEDVRRFVVHKLAAALERDHEATPDVAVACALSLGRVRLPYHGGPGALPEPRASLGLPVTASRESQAAFLVAVLRDVGRDRLVRAHAAASLGPLLEGDDANRPALARWITPDLLARVDDRREAREVRQSCALALGLIGDDDDDELDVAIRRKLSALASGDSDRVTQCFARIALGRAASRRGDGAPASIDGVRQELVRGVTRGRGEDARWSALALALFERALAERGLAAPDAPGDALRSALRRATAPDDVGAFAIACGMLGDPEAQHVLLPKLGESEDDAARGHVALALGLIGAGRALDPVRAVVDAATYRPALLFDGALSLALLGDERSVPTLAARLERAGSLASQAALAQALGRIGDARGLDPLLALFEDESRTATARALAVLALGAIADEDPLPWDTAFALDVNYAAAPATLFDQSGRSLLGTR